MVRRSLLAVSLIAVFAAGADAHPGSGLVVDRAGRIFFTDLAQIWRADPDGTVAVAAPHTHTHTLALDRDGALLGEHVAYDAGNGRWLVRFWRLTPDGRLDDLVPLTATPPDGWSILKDPDGAFYTVRQNDNERRETLLLRRAPSGEVSVLAGGAYGHADGVGPMARFESIGGLAWGPDGALYATDGRSVRRVTREGAVTTVVAELPSSRWFETPLFTSRANTLMGIAVAPGGDIYVADIDRRCVWRVAPTGEAEIVMESDRFWAPTGVSCSGEALLVLEYGKDVRVRRVTPGGRVTTVASVPGELAAAAGTIGLDVLVVIGLGLVACALLAVVLLRRAAHGLSGRVP